MSETSEEWAKMSGSGKVSGCIELLHSTERFISETYEPDERLQLKIEWREINP